MKLTIYILILISVIATSCKKVITVDLNEANPQIVVSSRIDFMESDTKGTPWVHLHWTASVYETESLKVIDNAVVKVIDMDGKSTTLTYANFGFYTGAKIKKGQIGDQYKLQIEVDGKTITSDNSLSSSVKIDSLTYAVDNFGPHQGDGYTVTCHFTDPASEVNYYYLKIKINGEYQRGYFITRDDGFDGKTISYAFFRNIITEPSTVIVELYTLDEESFEYFKVLAMMEQGGMSTAPGNPPSNIKGDAIGLFFVGNLDIDTVQIP